MGLMAVRAVLALGVAGLAQAGAQRVGRVAGRRRALWAVAGLAVAFGSGLLQLGSHWGDWGGEWLTSLTGWAGGGLISACIGAMVLVGLVRFVPLFQMRRLNKALTFLHVFAPS